VVAVRPREASLRHAGARMSMLSTVGHAGDVLDLFTAEQPEWGVTTAARRLGIPKSQAHDLLASLTAIGLLEHVPHGRYRLGWRSLALASTQMRTNPLRLKAGPIMRQVAEHLSATVLLFVWDRGWLVCVDRQDPARPLHISLPPVGARFRANGSAAGRVLLAHRPPKEIGAVVRAQAGSTNASDGAQSVEAGIERTRKRGYAAGRDGGSSGAPVVAAPIRDARDDVVAALSIAAPGLKSQADMASCVDVVIGAAGRISRALCDAQVASLADNRGLSGAARPERRAPGCDRLTATSGAAA
jgi:DNA-binding IclR family transcriptional regulator